VETFFIQESIFWGGFFLLFSSVFYMVSSPIVLDDTEEYHIGNINGCLNMEQPMELA